MYYPKFIVLISFLLFATFTRAGELNLITDAYLFSDNRKSLEDVVKQYHSIDRRIMDASNHILYIALLKRGQGETQKAISKLNSILNKNAWNLNRNHLFELLLSLEAADYLARSSKMGTGYFYKSQLISDYERYISSKYKDLISKSSFLGNSCFSHIFRFRNHSNHNKVNNIYRYLSGMNVELDRIDSYSVGDVVKRYGGSIARYRTTSTLINLSDAKALNNYRYYCYKSDALRNLHLSTEAIDWFIDTYHEGLKHDPRPTEDLLLHYVLVYPYRLNESQLNKIIDAFEKHKQYETVAYIYQATRQDKVFGYLISKTKDSQFKPTAVRLLSMFNVLSKRELKQLVDFWLLESNVTHEDLLKVIVNNKRYLTERDLNNIYLKRMELSRKGLLLIKNLFKEEDDRKGKVQALVDMYDNNIDKLLSEDRSFAHLILKQFADAHISYNSANLRSFFFHLVRNKKIVRNIPAEISGNKVEFRRLVTSSLNLFLTKDYTYQYEDYLFDWLYSEIDSFSNEIINNAQSRDVFRIFYNSRMRLPARKFMDYVCKYRRDNPDRIVKYRGLNYPEHMKWNKGTSRILDKLIQADQLTPLLQHSVSVLRLVDSIYVDDNLSDCVEGKDSTLPSQEFLNYLAELKNKAATGKLTDSSDLISNNLSYDKWFGEGVIGDPIESFWSHMMTSYKESTLLMDLLDRPYVQNVNGTVCAANFPVNEDVVEGGLDTDSICFAKENGSWKIISYYSGGAI